jgi:ubiquinone/menaquinone biosynthesis C-methylase UbiE
MFADPVKILQNFGLADAMVVADFGAGSGFYSVAAAKMAPNGKVYAIEVQKDFLPTIKLKAQTEGLKNIECIWGDIEKIGGTKIGDKVADVVIISNVLFMAENKKKLLEEAHRILKSDGRVLFIDWSDSSSSLGPTKDRTVDPKKARQMFEIDKFVFDRNIDAGEHHYGMIFKKI